MGATSGDEQNPHRPGKLSRFRQRVPVWEAGVIGTYAAIRLLSMFGKQPRDFTDSGLYFHFRGFRTARPWSIVILFDGIQNPKQIIIAQVLIACASWGFLAHMVSSLLARRAPTWVRIVLTSSVLVFALTTTVAEWDYLLLSESLSISLMVAWIASLLFFFQRPGAGRAGLSAAIGFFWLQTRDTNTLMFITIVATVGLLYLLRRWRGYGDIARTGTARRVALFVALSALVLFASLALSVRTNDNYLLFPDPTDVRHRRVTVANVRLMDTFGKIAFNNPRAVKYMVDHGMPGDAATKYKNFAGNDQDFKMYEDEAFVHWVNDKGLQTYVTFLARQPWRTLREPFGHGGDLLAPQVDYYFANTRHLVPAVVDDFFWPKQPGMVLEVTFVALAAAGIVGVRRRRAILGSGDAGNAYVMTLAWIASIFPTLVITWQLEWLEAARHNVPNNIALRVSVMLLVAATVALAGADFEPKMREPEGELLAPEALTS